MRRFLFALFGLAMASSTASAQSKRGTWEGSAYWSSGSQRLVVVLDSTASGWSGAMVGQTSADSTRLVSVSVKADTVSFGIPYNGAVVSISGLVADGKFSGGMWFNNQNAGTVELTRKSEGEKKP
jgi:hypothetical protein